MIVDDKAALRQDMHARRAALGDEQRSQAANTLAARASALLALTSVQKPMVSSFWAIGSEIDLKPLEVELLGGGSRLCLPVMVAKMKPLLFRSYNHGDPMRERAWGIHEPKETAEVVIPDLLLVPLLAVDPSGARLGYGGGFYDRTLGELRRTRPIVAVGVGYDEQVVSRVPTEEYDELLDWVLTPTGLSKCTGMAEPAVAVASP